jgi:hypothetical protein
MMDIIEIDSGTFENDERLMNKIETILSIIAKQNHRMVNQESIYQENHLDCLLQDNFRYWPEPPSIINFDAMSPVNYYNDLLQNMIHDYVNHAIKQGTMLSYEDVRKNCSDYVDVYLKTKDVIKTSPKDSGELYNFRNSPFINANNWKAFLPKEDQLTIRFNRNKYMYVRVLKRNVKTKSATLDIASYVGNKNDWVITNRIVIDITFQPHKDNQIGCEWTLIDVMPYELFLLKHINDMNWSKEQKRFWKDAFSVCDAEELSEMQVDITETISEEHPIQTMKLIVQGKENQQQLQLNSNNIIKVKQVSGSEETLANIKNMAEQRIFIAYIKSIAIANVVDEIVEAELNKTKTGED